MGSYPMSPELIELAKAAAALPGWEWRDGCYLPAKSPDEAPYPCLIRAGTGGVLLDLLGPGWHVDRSGEGIWSVYADEFAPMDARGLGATLGEACARAALALGRWPGGAP